MTSEQRARRTADADALCARAFASAVPAAKVEGIALVAVGGYGRCELAPHSDLDVVFVHEDHVEVDDVAARTWYPLWDAGVDVDHAVRSLSQMHASAREDPRVALGLLDTRHLAGDPALTLRLRSELLAAWRRDARRRLPAVRALVESRTSRFGELADAAVPDLKEAAGGLRDATVLKALVATWLVDVPHTDLERSRRRLLDVRDAVQDVAGRRTDRILPEHWPEIAASLGLPDAETAHREVRGVGRRVQHLSRLTWRRVATVLDRPERPRPRTPALQRIAPGVAVAAGEVVLDGPPGGSDPTLLLRAAAEAAERSLPLSPASAARLVRAGVTVPVPWPAEARAALLRLLAAGPGLLPVWETLDETGALEALLPEWTAVRLLPHASVVHRFTVDRHLVETCIEASRLLRRVNRPDLLVLAALLHDIGKGRAGEHSAAGAPIARRVADRLGFDEQDRTVVGRLVGSHLLLARVATTRDLEDPVTLRHVADEVADAGTLELLAALTEADARATAPKAWSHWRSGLVAELVARVRPLVGDGACNPPGREAPTLTAVPACVRQDLRRVEVTAHHADGAATLAVASADRTGLLAAIAGALAAERAGVRSVRAWTDDGFAVSQWALEDAAVDPSIVRERLTAVLEGRFDPATRLPAARRDAPEPVVLLRHDASDAATVVEVRAADRPGLLHLACRALAELDVSVRSAHVDTLGPQALQVFYLQEPGAQALGEERAATAAHALREALGPGG